MQTQFAIFTMKNGALNSTVHVMVAYLNGFWVPMHIHLRTYYAQDIRLRDSGRGEHRTMDIGARGRGRVNAPNPDKWEVEVGMLMKRHFILDNSHGSIDSPMDWRVDSVSKHTFAELMGVIGQDGEAHVYNATLRVLLQRLWSPMTHPASLSAPRRQRIEHMVVNYMLLQQPRAAAVNTMYMGELLGAAPGALWKGMTYDPEYGPDAFLNRKNLCKRVGALIATCIRLDNDPDADHEGVLEELTTILRSQAMAVSLFEGEGGPSRREKIDNLLEGLHSPVRLADCGHFEHEGDLGEVLDGAEHADWCRHCYINNSVLCVDTDERVPTNQAFWSEGHEAYYSYDIDEEESDGEDEEYEDNSRTILDYSTNVTRILRPDPNLKSSPFGDFLMGLELEMTTGESSKSRNGAAKDVINQLGREYVVIKNDGSLPDDGFEVVTAPRGLAEHMAKFTAWDIDPGYRAWDTNQCGLHVHIHSRAFTEMTLGKYLMFINLDTNAAFIRKLAGRHPLKDHWAARFCAQEGTDILENPKAAIKGKSMERYRMVNTQNLSRAEAERLGLDPFSYSGKYDTVELRVFKASLRKERLLAQIEFAHAAVLFCRVASYRDLSGASFIKWLKPNAKLYPNLANWFGVRTSKALKDAKAQALEVVCTDKADGAVVVPTRAVRATRRPGLPSGLNTYTTPRARREAEERRLREVAIREAERLKAARERARALEERWNAAS